MNIDGIKNAKIESTELGYSGSGPFTAWLHLVYGGGTGQGFGGYFLDGQDLPEFMAEFVKGVLRVTDALTWEQVAGKFVRADADEGRVFRIGHVLKDEWFNPAALVKELRAKKAKDLITAARDQGHVT